MASVVIKVLDRLAPLIQDHVNLVIKSREEVQKFSSKLQMIEEVLRDAEIRGVTDKNVQKWLKRLQDLSYEMDDVLDEWEYANLELQIEGSEEVTDLMEKVLSFIDSLCSCFSHVARRRDIILNIKELNGRLDSIDEERNKYNFLSSGSGQSQEFQRPKSTSFVDFSSIYGRDHDKENLLNKLLSEKGESGIHYISLVGTGGIGKTTLAQLAYNDPEVKKKFDLKIWICVSDPFDENRIAKQILEAAGHSFKDGIELEALLQLVKNSIAGKRFLLILDDVWTEDYRKWEPLKNSLQGVPGSRILLTTRSESVAKSLRTESVSLGKLSEENCWSLLRERAFFGRTDEQCEKLEDIGRMISKKCDGLPLAARTLGSMLCLKTTVTEWQSVLESPLWEIKEMAVDLFPHLYLSYNELSSELKGCFSSCAIFPKDYRMKLDEIIRIWMAHGYLSSSASSDDVQLKGLEYFQKLAMQSFFQELEKHDEYDESNISCKMHDITHDFAIFLSKSERCIILDGGEEKGGNSSNQRTGDLNSLSSSNIVKIRTFSARNVSQEKLSLDLLNHLKGVRVLIVSDCNLQEVPQAVGKLFHLRYLDLSENPITELPSTLFNLYNLQTLNLQGCLYLIALPGEIHKLVKLRHLFISWDGIGHFPRELETLTGLWTLKWFAARRRSGNKLGYLKHLNQLRGHLLLRIEDLNEDENLVDAKNAELNKKIGIRKLTIIFYGEVRMEMMEALQPHPKLQSLHVQGYSGKQFPDWIVTSLNYLRLLWISSCENCSSLPPLGKLPMLEELHIWDMEIMKYLGPEFLGMVQTEHYGGHKRAQPSIGTAFPKLKYLVFNECSNWEEWEDTNEEEKDYALMPCLRYLVIHDCPKLKALPQRLLGLPSSLGLLSGESDIELERKKSTTGDEWVRNTTSEGNGFFDRQILDLLSSWI